MRRFALLLTASLVTVSALSARADIITALQTGSPTAVSNGYQYTYDVQLQGGQLDAVSNGSPVQFGTLYDCAGCTFTGSTGLLSTDFTFSFANTNTPASQTLPTDNPAIGNIRFTYNGSQNQVVSGQSTTLTSYNTLQPGISNLGTFTILSPYASYGYVNYDGQSYKGTNNTIQGNVGFVSAPVQSTVTPEPSSLFLVGTGLLGAAASLRRRVASSFAR